MTAYVIAILRPTLPVHADVLEYIERVQSTFEPYGGCFLSHGKPGEWVEGSGSATWSWSSSPTWHTPTTLL